MTKLTYFPKINLCLKNKHFNELILKKNFQFNFSRRSILVLQRSDRGRSGTIRRPVERDEHADAAQKSGRSRRNEPENDAEEN